MEDQTTTVPEDNKATGGINGIAIDENGMALVAPEPDESKETAAKEPETKSDNSETESDTGEVDSIDSKKLEVDEELVKWASNKGVSITSDAERKLAEMARNSEKAMHTKTGEASTLQKSVVAQAPTGDDEVGSLRAELQQLKLEQDVRNFYQDNPDAKEMDAELSKLVEERPHLAYDLEALYAVAKLKNLKGEEANIRKDGGREALEKLANKQRATSVAASATTQEPTQRITAQNVDQLIAQNGHEWYMENRTEINKVLETA